MDALDALVTDYIENHRQAARRELRFFEIQRSLDNAVQLAALAKGPPGKRFAHQRRIPARALESAAAILARAVEEMRKCTNFEELIQLIEHNVGHVPNIGELYIYDTALRIGAKLGIEPEYVYLHAGTRKGAQALRIDLEGKAVRPAELPPAFQRLKPREIEDCLCIHKEQLHLIALRYHNALAAEH